MNKLSGEKGFTLAEVLVGLVILAVGILAIAGMQIIAIKGNSFSRYLTRASVLAQESLESLKGLEISSERLNTGNYLDPDYKDPDIGIFKRSYRAIRNPDYVDLQYTVEWKENEHTHRVSFTTIKAR